LTLKRSRLLLIVLGSGLVGAVLGTAVVGFTLFGLAFVQSDENTFSVWIENDGIVPLVLKQCASDCTGSYVARLPPNEKVAANTVVNVPNWWRVEDQSGRTLGCLPLLFGRVKADAIVRTSQVQDCPQ
jgi:hypothetical protein